MNINFKEIEKDGHVKTAMLKVHYIVKSDLTSEEIAQAVDMELEEIAKMRTGIDVPQIKLNMGQVYNFEKYYEFLRNDFYTYSPQDRYNELTAFEKDVLHLIAELYRNRFGSDKHSDTSIDLWEFRDDLYDIIPNGELVEKFNLQEDYGYNLLEYVFNNKM